MIELTERARNEIDALAAGSSNLLYVNVSTEDGFVIQHRNGPHSGVEPDKVAALASTLFSLAESSSQDTNQDELERVILESAKSSTIMIRTVVDEIPAILTLAMTNSIAVGQAMYLAQRTAQRLMAA